MGGGGGGYKSAALHMSRVIQIALRIPRRVAPPGSIEDNHTDEALLSVSFFSNIVEHMWWSAYTPKRGS